MPSEPREKVNVRQVLGEGIAGEEPMSRVDWVYSRLRRAIVRGEFEPGQPLRTGDLSEIFGVSLIPIREAIRKLEMEKLVKSAPNRGAWVAPISARDVRDVYSIRMFLEEEALRRAIPNVSSADLVTMRSDYLRMLALGRRDDVLYWDRHRGVHFGFYERCGSPWLLHMIKVLWSHTERHRHLSGRIIEFALDIGNDFHGAIIECVAAGDVEGAVEALHRDLSRISDLIAGAYDTEMR